MSRSALTLLVARVGANDPNDAFASDDFALVTDFLNAGTNLHGCRLMPLRLFGLEQLELGQNVTPVGVVFGNAD